MKLNPALSGDSYPLRVWICLLSVLIAAAVLPLAGQEPKLSAETQSQVETVIARFMATTHTPGISVALVEHGQYEWAAGFGMSDLENGVPATEHTLYRLASISKSLTATAAMVLWERGKLDLDAPVQKYCPSFPPKPWPITTRQVLGHLAGIRHYKSDSQEDIEVGNTKHFDDPIEAGLNFFKNDALLSQPGTQFHYTTHGFTVVGCVIEGASGSKYAEFARQNVLLPAGMAQTQVDNRFAIIPYRARFYQKLESGAVVNADFLDSSYKLPGGGWLSSADDMARFEVAILNDKLVRRGTRDLMWKALKPTDGSKDDYALGWGNGSDGEVKTVGHNGGQQGTATAIMLAPEQGSGVVVLANMEAAPVDELATELLKIAVGLPLKKPVP